MGGKPQGYFALGPGLAGEGVGRLGQGGGAREGGGEGGDAHKRARGQGARKPSFGNTEFNKK